MEKLGASKQRCWGMTRAVAHLPNHCGLGARARLPGLVLRWEASAAAPVTGAHALWGYLGILPEETYSSFALKGETHDSLNLFAAQTEICLRP